MSVEAVMQPFRTWSVIRKVQIAVIIVAVMVGAGLLVRTLVARSRNDAPAVKLAAAHAPTPVQRPGLPAQNPPAVAEKAAKPILEKLKTDPNNFDLLVKAGNTYLYSRVFGGASDFYQRALQVKDDPDVRNDYASALFYSGDTDGALQQYELILKADPQNSKALFNRGMVRWRGKQDPQWAVESWKLLLTVNPDDPHRAFIKDMIAQASKHPARAQH